jgi:hypothetical protein
MTHSSRFVQQFTLVYTFIYAVSISRQFRFAVVQNVVELKIGNLKITFQRFKKNLYLNVGLLYGYDRPTMIFIDAIIAYVY